MRVSFRGLEIGDEGSESYLIERIDGWDSLPELIARSSPKPGGSLGSWGGSLAVQKRVVEVDLSIMGKATSTTRNTAARRALRDLVSLGETEYPLTICLDYGAPVEFIRARVTALEMPTGVDYSRDAPAQIEFTATDPRRLSLQEHTRDVAGTATVVNDGNAPADLVITTNTPGISITVTGGGRTRRITLPAFSGTATVDTRRGVVTAGGVDISPKVKGALISELTVTPGTNTITTTAAATAAWRDSSL